MLKVVEAAPPTLKVETFETPFGPAVALIEDAHLWALGFGEEPLQVLGNLQRQFLKSDLISSKECSELSKNIEKFFQKQGNLASFPLSLKVVGTLFQVRVWRALRQLSPGAKLAYSDLAEQLGVPQAHRAVANAVGRNPISYFIPCHRVLRKGGSLGGYRWGLEIKEKMLKWERSSEV